MPKKISFLFLSLLIISAGVFYFLNQTPPSAAQNSGNTYYVDGSIANDSGNGQSWETAKKYIRSGILLMSSGDTLMVADGTYTGILNRVYSIPSGSANAYTKVYAQTDFGVTLDNTQDGLYGSPVDFTDVSYIVFRGFNVTNAAQVHFRTRNGANHIKIIRCSSSGTGSDAGAFTAGDYSTYILFEECFAYGLGRYPFVAGDESTNNIIFRRCVVRFDGSDNTEPNASFASYTSPYVYFQNCIAIDGKDIRSADSSHGGLYKGLHGFYGVKMSDNLGLYGCIVLNQDGGGYLMEHQPIKNLILEDCVSWDLKRSNESSASLAWPLFVGYYDNAAASATLNRLTLGVSDINNHDGIVQSNVLRNAIFTNNIIYGLGEIPSDRHAVAGFEDTGCVSDYNCYYGNAGNRDSRDGVGGSSLAAANNNAINPLINGLKYLTRIESGSILKTAGQGNGQIGAQILYRYGVDADGDGICGLLTDDAGWKTLTNVPLWPFPNEDIIRRAAKSYSKAASSLAGESWISVSVDPDTDIITSAGHGLSNNNTITFRANTFPGGIYVNKRYYVRDVTTNTFKLTFRANNSAINITSAGSNVTYSTGWDNPALDGDRGFCADGNGLYGGPITLTSYIWEYLGNPCPPEICNYGTTPAIPNITLTLSADKNEIQLGDTITYTLTYQNISSTEAKNIILTDPIPQGTTYVVGSASNSGVYDAANNRITWTIPTLAAGATGAASFKVAVE